MSNNYIYCLENLTHPISDRQNPTLIWLENMALKHEITSVYQTCDDIESFQQCLETLLYEDRHFKDYRIIYLIIGGAYDTLEIAGYQYSLEEIAYMFEGKFKNKIIHLANTFRLELDADQCQMFLDITNAKALSGYINEVPISSTVLDAPYFKLCQELDDVVEITETLYENYASLCSSMGFNMYY